MNAGILGGGQLARMLALAGHPLGCTFTVLDPAPDACAASVANHIIGAYSDTEKLEELADSSDVITLRIRECSGRKPPVSGKQTADFPAVRSSGMFERQIG